MNIKVVDRYRETALLWAVQQENFDLVRLFLNFVTDNLEDTYVLAAAVKTGNLKIAEIQLEKSNWVISTIDLSLAIDKNYSAMVQLSLETACSVNSKKRIGNRLMFYLHLTISTAVTSPLEFRRVYSSSFPCCCLQKLLSTETVVYGNENLVRLLLSYGTEANIGLHGLVWFELKMEREERIRFESGRVIHVAMELRQQTIV